MRKKFNWGIKNTGIDNDTESSNLVSTTVQKTDSNHIYFYSDVDTNTCLDLNKLLQEKSEELLALSTKYGFNKPKIYLHINTFGGSVLAGVSSMDTILRLKEKVDIITIVEGGVASAGTFISIVGSERWMTRNSFFLIHQLSSVSWGKYNELKDDLENCDRFMEMIKNIYLEYSTTPEEELDKILSHDLWWTANKCLEMNIIDKIL